MAQALPPVGQAAPSALRQRSLLAIWSPQSHASRSGAHWKASWRADWVGGRVAVAVHLHAYLLPTRRRLAMAASLENLWEWAVLIRLDAGHERSASTA